LISIHDRISILLIYGLDPSRLFQGLTVTALSNGQHWSRHAQRFWCSLLRL